MTQPPANVLELPLRVRVEMALKAAWESAVLENARFGLAMHTWQNGKVVEIPPDEVRRLAAEILAS